MDFAISLLPESVKSLPVHMDFDGQKRAEKTFQIIIVLFGAVGFVWGYICQQFSQTMYILIAGFALSCLLTLPPWPMYRRKALSWQKVHPSAGGDGTSGASAPSPSQQKTKKKK